MNTKLLFFIITSVFVIAGCEHIEYGEIKTYTIKAGQHDSDFPKTMTAKEEIFVKVFFHKSCRYAPQPEGKSGWNKLVGLMPGLDPHNNSARWAWRYDHENGLIKLATYIYVKEERHIEYIYSVPLERWTELYVIYVNGYWKLLTGDNELGTRKYAPGFGEQFWVMGLWFGGNGVPEHDVQVSYAFGEKKGFIINTD